MTKISPNKYEVTSHTTGLGIVDLDLITIYEIEEIYKEEFFRYLALTPWKNFKQISGTKRKIRKIFNKIKKALMKI